MPARVAIVGAGPSGFYTAEALLAAREDLNVDIVEALPSPFGLIRGGVAPDHQTTKAVTRVFTRTTETPRLTYYGNVTVGTDVILDELRAIYDAVVLACGAPLDRRLDIPGADLTGVLGSAEFVGWYNGHPTCHDLEPNLQTESVVVVGNGNVAIDVARVLAKSSAEMAHSDLMSYAADEIHEAPIRDIYLAGRRGPLDAKFTSRELGELGQLAECSAIVNPEQLPAEVSGSMPKLEIKRCKRNLAILRGFADAASTQKRKRINFRFFANPVEVLGEDRVTGLRFERTKVVGGDTRGTGNFFDIPCGLVITAIGYRSHAMTGVALDERLGTVKNDDGLVEPGLYVVGWARRGPSGVIGTNRTDGEAVAELILRDLQPDRRPGGTTLESLLRERGCKWVSFGDWLQIDSAEVAAAPPGAPRRKFSKIPEMLGILEGR